MKTVTKPSRYLGISYGTPAPGDRVSINTKLARFQRPKNKTKITQYINSSKGVDWNLFGYVTAVRYPNGELEIINGQHRMGVVQDILPDVTEVPAHIVDVDDEQYAALLYWQMNGGSSSALKSEEQFVAHIEAGDSNAITLKRILENTKFSVGAVNDSANHRSIKYANFVKCVRFGSPAFYRACEIIDDYFPKQVVNDNFLSGLTRVFSILDYKDLMDKSTPIGSDFDQWIKLHALNGVTQKELTFIKYRNAGPWYDAAAYGLARFFFKKQRSQGRPALKLSIIEKIWKKHAESKDSDSDFFQ